MRLPQLTAQILARVRAGVRWRLPRRVPVGRILMGGECGVPAATYARAIGNLVRPSTPVLKGPHVQFLRDYAAMGDAIWAPAIFEATAYYRNAAECLDLTGYYFPYITQKGQIRQVAEGFVRQFCHGEAIERGPASGHSTRREPILLREIYGSDCYEMVDGNHRVAAAIVRGDSHVKAVVRGAPVRTPMQELLMDVLWQQGRLELYQPVGFPEVERWRLVRRCEDRLALMTRYLREKGIEGGRYLDVGSSYGWFPSRFAELGFDASGIERDPAAIRVGQLAYGNRPAQSIRGDVATVLHGIEARFDVVSCFSVLHHFAMGKAAATAEELMRLLAAHTGKVLFIETGQNHEEWFRTVLPQWDVAFIRNFVMRNSDFKEVDPIGIDTDGAGWPGNYGRMLFACTR